MRPGAPLRVSEAALTATAGSAMGAAVGSLFGGAVPLAVVAGVNGAISGYRRVYDWRRAGALAFALDSTWASATTFAGLAAHAVAAVRPAGYSAGLSERQNRHVYSRGLQIRRGFATTFGNVVCGAGDLTRPRRAKLVTDHEDVHAWQARWFGPLYPVLYGTWLLGGGAVGAVAWATKRRDQKLSRVIESYAYYTNPFEWWAYSRDDHWPPSGLVRNAGWKRPAVRPFARSGSHNEVA